MLPLMVAQAEQGEGKEGRRARLARAATGLSARLLVLTVIFVMIAEVLIFVPSVARFRLTYLEEKIESAHLAVLALEATPDNMVSEELEQELLDHVGAEFITVVDPQIDMALVLMRENYEMEEGQYDLRAAGVVELIADAFGALFNTKSRIVRVIGNSPTDPAVTVELIFDEQAMCRAIVDFASRIALLSLVISLITAALVYLALHWLLVRPMRRLMENMTAFAENPEDARRVIRPSHRRDEIGVAERELAELQRTVRSALRQRSHLAALGEAVAKINHDLRNLLSSASLLSSRLENSEDPEVRRVTPILVKSIDRAAELCQRTLDYSIEEAAHLNLGAVLLHDLLRDVGASFPAVAEERVDWNLRGDPDLKIEADREQLYRVFHNLGQNAVQAGASVVRVTTVPRNGVIDIHFADNGPGLAPRARQWLFQPFAGAGRAGGTGLGLAIAREILRSHGGDIALEKTDSEGTTFVLTLPRAAVDRS
jgi:signal transduction histidine kinase